MEEKLYAQDLAACPSVFSATRDDQAPLFSTEALIVDQITEVSLEDLKGSWVILFFYPSDFTFV